MIRPELALLGLLAPADGAVEHEEDEDIVTRLWAKNLETITLVTAEEFVRASGFGLDELELQTQGYMSMPVGSLRELLDRERATKAAEKEGAGGTAEPASGNATSGTANRNRRFQTNVVGYDVSDEEHEALTQEIQRETARDATAYILDILSAVLASEPSPVLLTKLFDVWDHVLEALIRAGQCTLIETVLTMLQEAETVRPDLSESHKQQVAALFDGLGRPERLKAIGVYLNRNPQANTEGLITLLLMMKPAVIPGLCSVLATLDTPAHQAVVMETLQSLARDHAEPIIRGLTDKRPTFVRNLLTLISRWNDARFADSVEKALRHPEEIAFTGGAAADRVTTRSCGVSCDKAMGVYEIIDGEGHPIWAWATPLPQAFGDVFKADEAEHVETFLEAWSQPVIGSTQEAPEWPLLAPGQTTLDELT